VVLSVVDIKRFIEELPEPSKSIVTLIVFASLRVGEVLALRWKRFRQIVCRSWSVYTMASSMM